MGMKPIKPPRKSSGSLMRRRGTATEKTQRHKNVNAATNGQSNNSALSFLSTFVAIVAIYYALQYKANRPSIINSTKSSKRHDPTVSSGRRIVINAEDIVPNPIENDWNKSDPIIQNTFNFLSNYVCKDENNNKNPKSTHNSILQSKIKAYCHPLLQPSPKRRTHYVAKTTSSSSTTTTTTAPSTIKRGEIVMVLPRHLLIWDLDAMRNREFIQSELFGARHRLTLNPLDSGAFLAAFLVYIERRIKRLWSWDEANNTNDDEADGSTNLEYNQKLLEYLNILPSYEDYVKTHPTLWDDNELMDLFGKETVTYQLVQAYRTMISSEYKSFNDKSPLFRRNVSVEDYTRMRINVMSRSFGPGPPGEEEALPDQEWDGELNYYQNVTGVDLRKGCRAMSPVLDIWDHHARPNVEWRYVKSERAFIIKAVEKEILPWNDIMVSYGMYTDSHLFAKFGFVNDDGSGHTEISIAVMHKLLDHGLGQQFSSMIKQGIDGGNKPLPHDQEVQRKNLLQYLVADDGYEECIEEEKHPEAYELKRLKFLHLQAIANKRDRWTVKFQPRNRDSKPADTSSTPIQKYPSSFDPGKVKFDGSKVIETCRLLALTNEDFGGKAIAALRNALDTGNAEDFKVIRQSDELEYRALSWLARLTNVALKKYPSTVSGDMRRLMDPNITFKSKEWYALQVRLGEMQSLEALTSIALSGTKQMMEQVKKQKGSVTSSAMFIRQRVCNFEYSMKLII